MMMMAVGEPWGLVARWIDHISVCDMKRPRICVECKRKETLGQQCTAAPHIAPCVMYAGTVSGGQIAKTAAAPAGGWVPSVERSKQMRSEMPPHVNRTRDDATRYKIQRLPYAASISATYFFDSSSSALLKIWAKRDAQPDDLIQLRGMAYLEQLLDVFRAGLFLRSALCRLPRIPATRHQTGARRGWTSADGALVSPFRLAYEIKHARPGGVDVADGGFPALSARPDVRSEQCTRSPCL